MDDVARTVSRPATSNLSIWIRSSISTSCETLLGPWIPRAFSKSENRRANPLELDLMLVMRAVLVALRDMIDSSWTVLFSKARSSGLPLVFWVFLA